MEDIDKLPSSVEEDSASIQSKQRIFAPENFVKEEFKDSEITYDSGFHSLPEKFASLEIKNESSFCSALPTLDKPTTSSHYDVLNSYINRAPNFYIVSDEDGDYLLHLAVIQCDFEMVLSICEKIPESKYLNFTNDLHQTPLHLAVLMKQPKICELLFKYGASIDSRDRNGQTPLHIACENGSLECVTALTNTNIHIQDLEIMNYEGLTCLHLAVIGSHSEIVFHLCSLYANVNAQDGKSGRTALHYAVEGHNDDLINMLVKDFKACVNSITYAGLTAERLARGRGYWDIQKLLISLGAAVKDFDDNMSDTDSSDYDDLVNRTVNYSNYNDSEVKSKDFAPSFSSTLKL